MLTKAISFYYHSSLYPGHAREEAQARKTSFCLSDLKYPGAGSMLSPPLQNPPWEQATQGPPFGP